MRGKRRKCSSTDPRRKNDPLCTKVCACEILTSYAGRLDVVWAVSGFARVVWCWPTRLKGILSKGGSKLKCVKWGKGSSQVEERGRSPSLLAVVVVDAVGRVRAEENKEEKSESGVVHASGRRSAAEQS